jgi:hypothetical protein
MNNTNNKLIIQYKNFNTEMKQYFFKQSLKDNTDSYNESKTFFKNKNTDELTTKYYNIQIKNYMNKVLLLNSIIKNKLNNNSIIVDCWSLFDYDSIITNKNIIKLLTLKILMKL